jgi:hypothetical protein|nr:MAG TPA: hypothetical protein [Caudoviricetes sp.]
MQNAMRENTQPLEPDTVDDELIDVLITISVIAKRLAEKLKTKAENDKE